MLMLVLLSLSQACFIHFKRYFKASLCKLWDILISQVDESLEIKAYYAGHVLGAAMFHIRVGHQSIVYTVRDIF